MRESQRFRRLCWCCFSLLALHGALRTEGNAPAETYFFGPFFLGGNESPFTDRHPGDDMLPYTEDDLPLPERGNAGGSWSSAHHDLNSNGRIEDDEHLFVIAKRDDDAVQSFSVLSHPEYGVLFESEDWYNYHEARNRGPAASLTGDVEAEGDDFEHNDRRPWELESNAYLYNGQRANQHGKGKPRYYFEHINRSAASQWPPAEPWIYEEVEGFEKPLNFQNNLDDPTTDFDEYGPCRRDFMRTYRAVTRGYLIPVTDLAALHDGVLPSLFGWETVDLARYLRDTIAPKLEDSNLELWLPDVPDPYRSALPATHVMLLQVESPMEVGLNDICPDGLGQARSMAEFWGIPERGGTYRVSSLLGLNSEVHANLYPNVRQWTHAPAGGENKNMWLLDHFFRHDSGHLGTYEFNQAPWDILVDPALGVLDATTNNAFACRGPASFRVTLSRTIVSEERPWELVVDLAVGDRTVRQQLILEDGDAEVVAYADVGLSDTAVHIGGELDPRGVARNPAFSARGPAAQIGVLEVYEFSRYVLRVTEHSVLLLEALPRRFAANHFGEFASFRTLAEVASEEMTSFSCQAVRVTVTGLEGTGSLTAAIDTLAFLAALPPGGGELVGPFLRGDCDGNGSASGNVTDAIVLLRFNFASGPTPSCLAACDADGDGRVRGQVSDAVYLLNFSYRAGPWPAAPYPECHVSPEPGDVELGCDAPHACR